MKTCKNKTCAQTNPQPMEAFAKKVRNADGLQRECRYCVSQYKKERRAKLGETLLIAKRASYHRNKNKKVPQEDVSTIRTAKKLVSTPFDTCHQKLRRDATEEEDRLAGHRFDLSPKDFQFCSEALSPEHRQFIERYEWLGTLGFSPKWCFTARYEGKLAGVVLMAKPTMGSVYKHYEALIQRGACSSWAPKNLNSKLVMFACNWMVDNTDKRLFIAYSDSEAGEIGTIYQACNFLYLGNTFGRKEGLQLPNGKVVTQRQFTCTSYMRRWAKELGIEFKKEWLKSNGFQDLKAYPAEILIQLKARAREEIAKYPIIKVPTKGKYVLILGRDKRELKRLQEAIQLKNFPYPKRKIP